MIIDIEEWKAAHKCPYCEFHNITGDCTNETRCRVGISVAQMLRQLNGGVCPYFEKKKVRSDYDSISKSRR